MRLLDRLIARALRGPVEALVAERGLAEALRAGSTEFQSAEDVARGIQTA